MNYLLLITTIAIRWGSDGCLSGKSLMFEMFVKFKKLAVPETLCL